MPARPARQIDASEIATYERDGAVLLKGIYQNEWIDLLRNGVDEAMHTSGRYSRHLEHDGEPVFFTDYCASDRVPSLKTFALDGPAAEVAALLMRSNRSNFLFDGIFVKDPGVDKPSLYHQDQPYYCVEGRQIVVLWAPLDPVPRDVSLRCVRGSHDWGTAFRPRKFRDGDDFGRGKREGFADPPDVESRYSDSLLSWDLEPGDVIAFHGMTIHGAPGNNQKSTRRRATNSTWTGDDAVYVKHPGVMEPDFPDCGLASGDPIDCDRFPRVFDSETWT